MIARWANGAAMAVATVALLACGGGADSTTGPDGVTVLPSGAVRLAAGQSTALTAKNALKIDAGATGTENVLVLVDTGLTTISDTATYTISPTGIGTAGAISPPATSRSAAPATTAAATLGLAPALDMSYGMRLNSRYRSRFRGGLRGARAAYNSSLNTKSGALRSLSSAAPVVGDIVTLNVRGDDACGNIQLRGARVVAIGTKSIVLADTTNPSGGFSTADYQRFAARFDTLVYPLDVANFGAPADIDKNDKVLLLFTGAVNALTPAKSSSYVGGFFFGRDLFPTTTTPEFGEGCAGSNYAEMFYLLAPDPTGTINGNPRPTGFVDSVTTSVIAHEFQHLINASRRMYVTPNVQDFEESWLDEGLAHAAEELLFFHESNLTPRSNITLATLRSTNQIRFAFNRDQSSNTGRYGSFLEAPSESSPFRGDDSLETRGATWNLLRYLVDRKAGSGTGSDAATFQALVNTARIGISNLSAVFGPDLPAQVRDWNISHYTDDLVAGVASEYTQPSWNYHNIFPGLGGGGNPYPLKVTSLAATGASGKLIGGSAAYYRFSIPAGATANITLTAPGPVSARVIRVR